MVSHKFIYIAAESAQSVIVTGTFDEWKANAQMESKGAGKWEKAIEITPGEVMYKFVVDGQWGIAEDQPTKNDESGHANNVVTVQETQSKEDLTQRQSVNSSPTPSHMSKTQKKKLKQKAKEAKRSQEGIDGKNSKDTSEESLAEELAPAEAKLVAVPVVEPTGAVVQEAVQPASNLTSIPVESIPTPAAEVAPVPAEPVAAVKPLSATKVDEKPIVTGVVRDSPSPTPQEGAPTASSPASSPSRSPKKSGLIKQLKRMFTISRSPKKSPQTAPSEAVPVATLPAAAI